MAKALNRRPSSQKTTQLSIHNYRSTCLSQAIRSMRSMAHRPCRRHKCTCSAIFPSKEALKCHLDENHVCPLNAVHPILTRLSRSRHSFYRASRYVEAIWKGATATILLQMRKTRTSRQALHIRARSETVPAQSSHSPHGKNYAAIFNNVGEPLYTIYNESNSKLQMSHVMKYVSVVVRFSDVSAILFGMLSVISTWRERSAHI